MACSISERLTLALALTLASSALAGPGAEEASGRALAQQAKHAFDSGDFNTASARYQEAYAHYPAPSLLFNLGQCHRRLGEFELAVDYFKRYLQSGPPPVQAEATREVIHATEDEALHARLRAAQSEAAATAARSSEAEEASRRQVEAEQARALAAQSEAAEAKARLDEALSRRDEVKPVPLTGRWYFWAGLAAVAAGGIATGIAVANAPRPTPTTFPDINAR